MGTQAMQDSGVHIMAHQNFISITFKKHIGHFDTSICSILSKLMKMDQVKTVGSRIQSNTEMLKSYQISKVSFLMSLAQKLKKNWYLSKTLYLKYNLLSGLLGLNATITIRLLNRIEQKKKWGIRSPHFISLRNRIESIH